MNCPQDGAQLTYIGSSPTPTGETYTEYFCPICGESYATEKGGRDDFPEQFITDIW